MDIKQIRNATMTLNYGGVKFLIDPMLSDKGTLPAFPSVRKEEANPLHELPEEPEIFLQNVDAIILTHSHADHWDEKAEKILDKNLPIFVQDEYDASIVRRAGFSKVEVLENKTVFNNVTMRKIKGQHYENPECIDKIEELAGTSDAMGIIFQANNENTLYLAGDTVWYSGVKRALLKYQPEVVILNAGGNQLPNCRLIMDEKEVYQVHQTLPNAQLIASHMEGVNHWGVSRAQLKNYAQENNFQENLLVPEDGTEYEDL
ncbi:MBL fold metallo-hydrolase [Tetragenococcus halophilus]|uniref:MBL fold metallo-hydrolase n=1 Tax=Tetragenococcus halophilus TaxID=51669 RepID=A0AB37D6K8_TETHA|nr:MBL fold metallo-hydrolase [Tetragenococcus halophilus]MCO7026039.1 MBL fold metallo-hydrolase [Tetragenococcus halophilus]QGP77208.1 MBL fold metallo-hydrolase [Tetragenococcus halophilus]GBD80310.1 putative uncharacterized protein [Tetragenococcus halophilus subsp. halophilus]GBD83164.1 putative uncharacterized protein [Tetragenococcus halophilus subsp. halophilus]GFK22486.1 UPF0173 protein YddR [Tetragenococcus halophilus]